MADRKPFLLRLDPETMAALRSWSADDLRSLNGQIEFLLRRALRDSGRLPSRAGEHMPKTGVSRPDQRDDRAPAAPQENG